MNNGLTDLVGWVYLEGDAPGGPEFDNRAAIEFHGGQLRDNSQQDMYVTNQPGATIKSWYTGEYSSSLSAHFENHGTVEVFQGGLSVGSEQSSGTDDGLYFAAPGTTLGIYGNRTLEGDVAAAGANLTLHGGTIAVNGSFAANTVRAEINRLDFNNPQTTMNAFRMISSYSGTASFNMPSITLTELDFGGGHAVAGQAEITLAPGGISNWGGYDTVLMGDPAAPNRLIVSAGATIDLDSFRFGRGRIVENHGLIDWNGASLWLESGGSGAAARIDNAGVFRLTQAEYSGTISPTGSGAAPSITNLQGGLFLLGSPAYVLQVDVPVLNQGTVRAQAGTFRLRGGSGGASNGLYEAEAGGTVRFDAGTHTLGQGGAVVANGTAEVSGGTLAVPDGSQVSGSGVARFSGGTADVDGTYDVAGTTQVASSGLLDVGASAQTSRLDLSGGAIGGTGTLTLIGSGSTWTGDACVTRGRHVSHPVRRSRSADRARNTWRAPGPSRTAVRLSGRPAQSAPSKAARSSTPRADRSTCRGTASSTSCRGSGDCCGTSWGRLSRRRTATRRRCSTSTSSMRGSSTLARRRCASRAPAG